MKSYWILLVVLTLATLLFFQCNRTTYTADNFSEDYISFGNGGGFTGAKTTYFLLPNGQRFSKKELPNQPSDLVPQTTVNKEAYKSALEVYQTKELAQINYRKPGNLYYFINVKTGDQAHEIIWNPDADDIPAGLKALFEQLNAIGKDK